MLYSIQSKFFQRVVEVLKTNTAISIDANKISVGIMKNQSPPYIEVYPMSSETRDIDTSLKFTIKEAGYCDGTNSLEQFQLRQVNATGDEICTIICKQHFINLDPKYKVISLKQTKIEWDFTKDLKFKVVFTYDALIREEIYVS
jgi:hypothetical protein